MENKNKAFFMTKQKLNLSHEFAYFEEDCEQGRMTLRSTFQQPCNYSTRSSNEQCDNSDKSVRL